MQQSFTITGMNCEACVKLISKKLNQIENVEQVQVCLNSNSVTIDSAQPISNSTLQQALSGTQYEIQEGVNS